VKTKASGVLPGLEISSEDQADLVVDALTPARVMRPRSPQELAEGLQALAAAPAAAVIHGGDTQIGFGSRPARYDVALSTTRLSRLLEHEPADLTCRAEAGMRVGELQEILRAHGQRLPLDPPRPEIATLGGMVAANSSGLSRARYGGVRDWVIGIAVAYPNGAIARAGGKVVKNVAGYDLMKLHTGALGTLGVIVELNFKVQTTPEAETTVLGHFEQRDAALAAGRWLARQYLAPAAITILDREVLRECGLTEDWRWTLAMRLEGYRREVEIARDQAAAAVRDHGGRVESQPAPAGFWESVRDWTLGQDSAVLLYATTSLSGLSRVLDAAGSDSRVMAEPAAGAAYVRVASGAAVGLLERMRHAAQGDGQVVVRRAPAAVKNVLDVFGPPPPGFALMRELKRTLDPKGILNPGRFVGGI
jgi:glycolate oxidase FAD binding subunit